MSRNRLLGHIIVAVVVVEASRNSTRCDDIAAFLSFLWWRQKSHPPFALDRSPAPALILVISLELGRHGISLKARTPSPPETLMIGIDYNASPVTWS